MTMVIGGRTKKRGVSALGAHGGDIAVAFKSTVVALGGSVHYSESGPRRKHKEIAP
jgi:hypothetical protein